MSFNWRLLLAPEPVLDYVVWHEVCHLEVMDHSPRFWALLAERCPDYREHVRWLRRHGATLVLESARRPLTQPRPDAPASAERARRRPRPPLGSITSRAHRPRNASVEPSPRTSIPARTLGSRRSGPASSSRADDLLDGFKALDLGVDGPLRGARRELHRPRLERVERGVEVVEPLPVDPRPRADGQPPRHLPRSQPALVRLHERWSIGT